MTDIVAGSRSDEQVLSLAAALEKGSSHPLAIAILDRAQTDRVPTPPSFDANAVAGEGIAQFLPEDRLSQPDFDGVNDSLIVAGGKHRLDVFGRQPGGAPLLAQMVFPCRETARLR